MNALAQGSRQRTDPVPPHLRAIQKTSMTSKHPGNIATDSVVARGPIPLVRSSNASVIMKSPTITITPATSALAESRYAGGASPVRESSWASWVPSASSKAPEPSRLSYEVTASSTSIKSAKDGQVEAAPAGDSASSVPPDVSWATVVAIGIGVARKHLETGPIVPANHLDLKSPMGTKLAARPFAFAPPKDQNTITSAHETPQPYVAVGKASLPSSVEPFAGPDFSALVGTDPWDLMSLESDDESEASFALSEKSTFYFTSTAAAELKHAGPSVQEMAQGEHDSPDATLTISHAKDTKIAGGKANMGKGCIGTPDGMLAAEDPVLTRKRLLYEQREAAVRREVEKEAKQEAELRERIKEKLTEEVMKKVPVSGRSQNVHSTTKPVGFKESSPTIAYSRTTVDAPNAKPLFAQPLQANAVKANNAVNAEDRSFRPPPEAKYMPVPKTTRYKDKSPAAKSTMPKTVTLKTPATDFDGATASSKAASPEPSAAHWSQVAEFRVAKPATSSEPSDDHRMTTGQPLTMANLEAMAPSKMPSSNVIAFLSTIDAQGQATSKMVNHSNDDLYDASDDDESRSQHEKATPTRAKHQVSSKKPFLSIDSDDDSDEDPSGSDTAGHQSHDGPTGDAVDWTAKTKAGNNKFPCTYTDCPASFKTMRQLYTHKENGHDYCSVCDLDFDSFDALHVHKVMTEQHVVCPICSADFQTSGARTQHINSHHPEPADKKCPGCGEIFARGSGLIAHMEDNLCNVVSKTQFHKARRMITQMRAVVLHDHAPAVSPDKQVNDKDAKIGVPSSTDSLVEKMQKVKLDSPLPSLPLSRKEQRLMKLHHMMVREGEPELVRRGDGTIIEEFNPASSRYNPGLARRIIGGYKCPHQRCL